MFDYVELEQLVETGDYKGAEDFCRAALAAGLDPQFWETQLGYVYFLNERDHEAYYNRAPATFMSLVAKSPSDENARFWLGYVYLIVLHNDERAEQELRKVLTQNPIHPYANLIMASIVDSKESVGFLRQVLEQQPASFQALRQLADLLLRTGQKAEAERMLKTMLTREAYVERDYGIMNRYINGVMTGATWEQERREEARAQLKRLSYVPGPLIAIYCAVLRRLRVRSW